MGVFETAKMEMLIQRILPALGRNADLKQWQNELWQMQTAQDRLLRLAKGEWNAVAEQGYLVQIWHEHFRHRLADPEDAAMVIAEISSKLSASTGTDWDFTKLTDIPSFEQLTPEGQEVVESMISFYEMWSRGMREMDRSKTLTDAMFELLVKERTNGKLEAGDIAAVTKDPATGAPFAFDSATGVLNAPATGEEYHRELEITLPWRNPTGNSTPKSPQER